MQLLPKHKIRLLFARFFAGAMLCVWFANSLPPLLAMTAAPVEFCQMECCQGFKRHSMDSSSADMCPMMARKNASHQATPDTEHQAMQGAEQHQAMHGVEEPSEEHAAQTDEHIVVGTQPMVGALPINILIFDADEQSGSHRDTNLPSLRIRITESCPRTACIAGSSSSFGQRQQQSSDNCLLLSFAVNVRPPTFVLLDFGTQESFNLAQRIWSGQTPSRGPPAFLS